MKGSDIKAYLVENGLKQSHIAKQIGISEPLFNMMMNDKRGIDVNEYALICGALGVNTDKFLKPCMPDKTKSC